MITQQLGTAAIATTKESKSWNPNIQPRSNDTLVSETSIADPDMTSRVIQNNDNTIHQFVPQVGIAAVKKQDDLQ